MHIQYDSIPADTSHEAADVQTQALRQMGLEGRARLTFELMDHLRSVARSGIRHRHPDYTEQQITRAYLRLTLDPDLFDQVLPNYEIEP